MNQLISVIYKAVEEVEKSGSSAIGTTELKAYLSKLSELQGIEENGEISPVELEKYKAELSKWVEEHKAFKQWDFELFRATISSGQSALKSAMIINGGASIALLTFIGKLWGNENAQSSLLTIPLQIFLYGVLCAAIAAGTTYLAQWFFQARKEIHRKIGKISNIASILLVLGAYGCFLYGVVKASAVFTT